MCEHENYEAIGDFPENMFVEGEMLANKIKCNDCGKEGLEYYEFVRRAWT